MYLLSAAALVFVNWGIEALKWKLVINDIQAISFFRSLKAVLSGVSFSVSTPYRIGEYFGRVLYLPEGKRLKTISVTIVASLSQILITFISGIIGFIALQHIFITAKLISITWHTFILSGLIITTCILLFIYFKISGVGNLIFRWLKNSSYLYLFEGLKTFSGKRLLHLLLLSFLRYIVFLVQYVLLFHLFGVDVSIGNIFLVMSVVFLALAVIPTIVLAEIGLRGEITLQLMGLFSLNSLGMALTSVTIWLINLILPAIAGSLFILSIKVFKKNEMR